MTNPRVPFRLSTERQMPPPPDGKPLIVHIVVNIEHWPLDQPMPRAILQKPHGKSRGPDVANFCWVDHGLRRGMPRLIRTLAERGLPASAATNAIVVDVAPSLAEAVLDAGWEFIGHGVIQRSLEHEDDEVAVIEATLDKLQGLSGKRPRGWLGPGLGESDATPDHLAAAGIEFVFDWCLDDLPSWMRTKHGPVLAMPYTLELNDVVLFVLAQHPAEEYFRRYADTLDALGPELARGPQVLTLALHPHVIAQPHRLKSLGRVLDLLQGRDDTTFMTCSQIGDWFKGADQSGERDQVA